jgi:hypothetical protein
MVGRRNPPNIVVEHRYVKDRRYACVFCIASRRSRSSVILYRSKTLRVLWPLIFIATVSGTPAWTMLRIAVRRESWPDAGLGAGGRPCFLDVDDRVAVVVEDVSADDDRLVLARDGSFAP